MQNAGGVSSREAVRHARQQLDDLPPGARRGARPVLQCAAVDELRDDVLAPFVLADVVDRENMRMIQCRGHLRFALKAPPRVRVEQLARKELDGHRSIEPRVRRAVHHAHAAGAENAVDAVAADGGSGRKATVG